MRPKIEVLHIITGLHRGGAEAMLYKLLSSIDRQKFHPYVISLLNGGDYESKIADLGIPVYSFNMPRGLPSPLGLWRLRSLIKKIKPDIIHAWMYHAGLAALFTRSNVPCIIAIRSAMDDIDAEKRLTRCMIKLLGKVAQHAQSVVFCSRKSMKQHASLGYGKTHNIFIPNGFDCDVYRPMSEVRAAERTKWGIPQDVFVLGHVGRFHPVKDHGNLLNAFAQFSKTHTDAHLVLVGSGLDEKNPQMMATIHNLQIADKVKLLGAREDVPVLMNTFDIFVNASRSEAFPNVLGEAMACGIPCVATDVGDSSLIIQDSGVIVAPMDSQALSAAMERLYSMPVEVRKQLGTKARRIVKEMFSLEKVVDEYEKLYKQCAVGNRL